MKWLHQKCISLRLKVSMKVQKSRVLTNSKFRLLLDTLVLADLTYTPYHPELVLGANAYISCSQQGRTGLRAKGLGEHKKDGSESSHSIYNLSTQKHITFNYVISTSLVKYVRVKLV